MSLFLYGVVEADAEPVVGLGIDDRPLRAVKDGPLMAIVTDHEGPDQLAASGALDGYERTVQRLMDSRAILPAQFGRVLPDDEAVRAMLRRRRRDLLTKLDGVRGAVELGIHARWRDGRDADRDPRSESGAAYLRARLEKRESARRVASELDPLTTLSRSIRRALSPGRDLPVLDAYLVDRGRVGEFVALVEQLGACLDGVELVCTGPCPPYSFAESGAQPGGAMRSTV